MNANWVYGVSFALWGVWLQRHHAWSYFWSALTGGSIIKGTRGGGGSTGFLPVPGYIPDIMPGGALGGGGLPALGPGGTPELPSGVPELGPGVGEVPIG